MKKPVTLIIKILGVLLIIIVAVLSFVYYRSVNYDQPSLYVDEIAGQKPQTRQEYEQLAEELIAQMSIEEKIDQMYGEPRSMAPKFVINLLANKRFPHVYAGGNERLGIPPWVLSDGPRGARVLDKEINSVTTFPVAMARGASWNTHLEYRVNQVISAEMRANKVNYAATPCINLLRHPGWGRAQETYGEDPWLLGEFGIAAVRGIESNHVMACPKHFALNSIENSRWVVDVLIDERSLREVYLPHFKRTIQEGKPASIMSSYNKVRGAHGGSNRELLTDILRNDWGFEGFVSTDWVFGLYDGIAGVKAGLDYEMPWQQAFTYVTIKEGIETGEINEAQLDESIKRSLTTRLPYAFLGDQDNYPHSIIGQEDHIRLAREAAEESMVLLKNNDVLPFSNEQGKRIAVIGRLADVDNTGDHGSSDATPPYVISSYEGILAYHEKLGNEVLLNDGSDIESAISLAESVDEVVLVVGYTWEDEGEYIIFERDKMVASAEAGEPIDGKGEGGDRDNLRLRPEDEDLIKNLAGHNDQLVVVYIGGSAIDLSQWEAEVPAILFAWYGGMEGGNALANLLYGELSPSGKLPFSIAADTNDYPYFTPYTEQITYGYYHGYTLFEKKEIEPAYAFGYGLSYTDFTYSNLKIETPTVSTDSAVNVKVDITNTGGVAGKEVVQLYIGFSQSAVDRPVKLLRSFEKISLNPGETKVVELTVQSKDLARYEPESKQWIIEKMPYEVYVGSSSRKQDLLVGQFVVE